MTVADSNAVADIRTGRTSTWQILRTLLAKDRRLYRGPFVALGVAAVGCYLVPALAEWSRLAEDRIPFEFVVTNGAESALFLTALLASAFGGFAIAGERAENNADFLAMLPVKRRHILLSKWTVSFLMIAGFVLFHLAMVVVGHGCAVWRTRWGAGMDVPPDASFRFHLLILLGAALSLFGLSWLLSTTTRSPAVSTITSIAVTVGVIVWMTIRADGRARDFDEWETTVRLAIVTGCMGLAGLVAGTIWYLGSVEP